MSTAQTTEYALARTPAEYERLRAQARAWEDATARLLDRIGLAPGARCLDAGCGPGETMRLLAERTGPGGHVLGLDTDAALGAQAIQALHAAAHRRCAFAAHDVTRDEPLPGGPFDLVHARLLLYHLPQRVEVLARLWDAVAPGGHLLVQDYEVRSLAVLPELETVDEFRALMTVAFGAAGADIHVGARLPTLFAQAGIGAPDGTDVAGRVEPLGEAQRLIAGVHSGILHTALAHGLTTAEAAADWRARFADDVRRFPERPVVWPLLIGAHRRKP